MQKKQSIKNALLNLFKYGIVLAIFYFLIRRLALGWGELDAGEVNIRFLPLFAALICFILFYTIVGYLSTRILNDCGGKLRILPGVRIRNLAMLGKYVPGKVWLVLGRFYLTGKEGVSIRATGIGLFYEILLMVSASLLVGCLFLPLIDGGIIPGITAVPLAAIGIVLLLAFLTRRSIVNRIAGLFLRKKTEKEVESLIPLVCFTPRFILGYLARFAFTWLIWALGFYCLTQSVLDLPLRALPGIAGLSIISWSIGFLSIITPGGLGVREGVLTYFLKAYTDEPIAILIALLSRIVITVSEILLVLLLEGLYHFSKRSGGGAPKEPSAAVDETGSLTS